MKTEWDYTKLADAYLKRPDYADATIDALLAVTRLEQDARVCDVGAGVAHLTLMLAARSMDVTAVEPNDAMRANGIKRTTHLDNVRWFEGTGEASGQPSQAFDLVTFGSSFNVCERQAALRETARILRPQGWFACLWNHRQLEDPIQARIEAIIKEYLPSYGYGSRREEQAPIIDASGLFGPVVHLDARVVHRQDIDACVEAWRSHATLERQAGPVFERIVADIEGHLRSLDCVAIDIPYSTNAWLAQLR